MVVAWLVAGFSLVAGLLLAFIVLTIELFLVVSDRKRAAESCSLEPNFVSLVPEKQKMERFVEIVEKVTTQSRDRDL